MRKTANKILKDNPEADEALLGLAEELDEKHALAALADTEGGKLLLDALITDVTSIIERLRTSYKEASHIDLIVLCARLDAKLSEYQALKRARKNKEELEQVLKDALS